MAVVRFPDGYNNVAGLATESEHMLYVFYKADLVGLYLMSFRPTHNEYIFALSFQPQNVIPGPGACFEKAFWPN